MADDPLCEQLCTNTCDDLYQRFIVIVIIISNASSSAFYPHDHEESGEFDLQDYEESIDALSILLHKLSSGRDIEGPKGRVTKGHVLAFLDFDLNLYDKLAEQRDAILQDFFEQAREVGVDAMKLGWEHKNLALLRIRSVLKFEAYALANGMDLHRCTGSWVANFLLQSRFYYIKKITK